MAIEVGGLRPEAIAGSIMGPIEPHKLGEYHANDKHVLFTRHGLVRLPPALHHFHIRELMRLKVQPSSPDS